MQIGPRYKKARYLGAPVFRKTQTQKFAMRSQKKTKVRRGRGGKSEYGQQLLEKQKARYSYGVSSGQFTNYVKKALKSTGDNSRNLLKLLEGRLDNIVLRANFALSRFAARQMVSHGHIMVNDKIVTIPSYEVKIGDKISIREGSKKKGIFTDLDQNLINLQTPEWIKVDTKKREIAIASEPSVDMSELLFDVRSVLEFYTR
ncbi:MAG: 30S ribosomal protein S4 [Candidatus Paceibacterota bacterium]|jgi:small subunit ribosomal protein S4